MQLQYYHRGRRLTTTITTVIINIIFLLFIPGISIPLRGYLLLLLFFLIIK
jgi:hypothetical protein